MKSPCRFLSLLLAAGLQASGEDAARPATRISRLLASPGGEAWLITDGKTEATFVPALGRILHYAAVGGTEWLWKAPAGKVDLAGWVNYGGEKAWVSPQHDWPLFLGRTFPPDPVWESAHHAEVRSDPPRLHTATEVSRCGIRIEREFSFNAEGEFVTTTTLTKVSGSPLMAGAWTVTQIPPPEAVFLPENPASAYQGGFHRFNRGVPDRIAAVGTGLLRVTPSTSGSYKIGLDSPVTAIAALREGTLFVQRGDHPRGRYPDGADEAGFPVELFDFGDAGYHYLELELLSPLVLLAEGGHCTFTVRWSLHPLPAPTPEAISALLGAGAALPDSDEIRTPP